MITICNKTARAIVLILNHPAFWKKRWGYQVKRMVKTTDQRDGNKQQSFVQRKIPGSLTIPARGILRDLPLEIEGCLQIKNLVKSGRITVTRQEEKIAIPTMRSPRTRKMQRAQALQAEASNPTPDDDGGKEE